MNENDNFPLLTNLEKKIILVLGQDLTDFEEISRYSSTDIKLSLNEYNQKYQKPFRSSTPTSTLKSLERKELVNSVFDREKWSYTKILPTHRRGN